eukprot:GEMP01042041.1.p1 GENE.GEMP01042041.1~~GEMP01042041.1.p1  ORF type:complete len:287 (+),score=65.53 GEMP01042041.1:39-899(+)
MELDCVIPLAPKDVNACRLCIQSLRRVDFQPRIGRIFVVSKNPDVDAHILGMGENERVYYHAESEFPLHPQMSGWLKQQLIKLYAPLIFDLQAVLLVDADVVWIKPCQFLQGNCALWNFFDAESVPFIRSHVDLHRFIPWLRMWGLAQTVTAVTHHGVFLRPVVEQLMARSEEMFGKPLWQVFLESTVPCSEYDLYFAFSRQHYPQTIQPRRLAFRIAVDPTSYDDVTYVVSHSHLRDQPHSELSKREGAINGTAVKTMHLPSISEPVDALRILNEVHSAYLCPHA